MPGVSMVEDQHLGVKLFAALGCGHNGLVARRVLGCGLTSEGPFVCNRCLLPGVSLVVDQHLGALEFATIMKTHESEK